jgi:hypothetical protein
MMRVLRICQESKGTFLPFFDLGQFVYGNFGVPFNLSLQDAGYLTCSEFQVIPFFAILLWW